MARRRYAAGVESVSNYDDACAWLWRYSRVEDWMEDGPGDPLPLEARLVCDTYWLTPEQLRRNMRNQWRTALGGDALPHPHRRNHRGR